MKAVLARGSLQGMLFKCLIRTFQPLCAALQTCVLQHAAVDLSPYRNVTQLSNIDAKMPRPPFAWDVRLRKVAEILHDEPEERVCINLSALWVS